MTASKTANRGYEVTDASVGRIVAVTIALVLVVGLVTLGVARMVTSLLEQADARDPEPHALATDEVPPGPRLQAFPARELAEHREQEARWTESYGWIDRERQRVRIPVERAMEVVLERGLPSRETRGER